MTCGGHGRCGVIKYANELYNKRALYDYRSVTVVIDIFDDVILKCTVTMVGLLILILKYTLSDPLSHMGFCDLCQYAFIYLKIK